MNIFYRRPLMLCCAAFLASAAVAFCVSGLVKQIMVVSLVALAVIALAFVIVLRKRKPLRIRLTVTALALLFAAVSAIESWSCFELYARSADDFIGEKCTLEMTVIEERRATVYDSEYTVELRSLNGCPMSGLAILHADSPAGLSRGEMIVINADCVELYELSYDDQAYRARLADGIINAAFSVSDSENLDFTVTGEVDLAASFADELSISLCHRLEDGIGGEAGKLASAMLLGTRHRLSDETDRDFARTGLSHILSISGLHMALLTGFIELILRLFRIPKTARCFIMPLFMLGYLMLTGFQVSAVRSAVMLTVVYISFIAASPSDIMTVLFAVCAGIVAVSPMSAADVGFWMSFLATMGIIVVSPYISLLFKRRQKDKLSTRLIKTVFRYVISAFAVTLAAVFSIVFLTWMCFGEFSLVAPLANLYASPLTTLLMILSLMWLGFGAVPFLGDLLAELAEGVGNALLTLTSKLSELRGVTVSLKYEFAAVIVVLFCISMAVMLTVRLRHKILALIPPVAAVVAFGICLAVTYSIGADDLSLSYLRRGEREVLLMTRNGQTVLCDFTDGTYSNHAAAWKAASEQECATELEVLLLTHYHDKHRGSVERLMSSVRVRALWLPEPRDEEEFYIAQELARIADEHGAALSLYSYGQELNVFGQGSIVLNEPRYTSRSTQPMLMLELAFGDRRAAYIGSSYLESEALEGEFDAVILGTHGPNPKLEYELELSERTKTLIFADAELFELAVPSLPTPKDTLFNCEYKKIMLTKHE